MALLLYPLLEVVKYAFESVIISSIQVLYRSPESPLYIKSSSIHVLIIEIYAKMLMNSLLPSYFNLVTRPDLRAIIIIILLRDLLKPIKNPFSLKL
jgi:hypothetical protein